MKTPLFGLLLLSGTACLAAETFPPLDELLQVEVEGASRYAQPLAEAPATATVVSAEDISRYGFGTLADALSMAPGVYASHDYTYTYLGVRGFNRPGDFNSRILLMVDGSRYNDVVFDQAMLGNEAPVDLAWVKRVEFVPGPSSSLYGGNALFGIANVMLWSGADINGTRVMGNAGSGGQTGFNLLSGGSLQQGGDWIVGVAYERRAGDDIRFQEFIQPGVSDGVARSLDGERWLKGFARYSGDGWRFTGSYSERYKDVPTAYYGTVFGATGNFVVDRHVHLDLTHAASLSPVLSRFARLHYGSYSYTGEYPLPGAINRDEALASWWSGEYRLTYTGLPDHQMQLGLEGRRNVRMDQRNLDLSPRVVHLEDHRSNNTVAAVVQDEWRLSRQWIANLGYRWDKVTPLDEADAGIQIGSPRMALIYRPEPGVSAKLLHGRAFRPPNAYERFYTDGNVSQKANPTLRPERIETTEVSLDYVLTPALRVGASHYLNRIRDLIDQVEDPVDGLNVYVNRPPVTARGWEASTEALIGGGWRLRGSLTWQRVEQDDGEPANSPHRLAKLFADGPLANSGWTLGMGIQAMSVRKSRSGTVPGHVVGDVTLHQAHPGPWGQWSLTYRNVGNAAYAAPGAQEHVQATLPQPGRQWLVRWEWRL